MSLALKTREVGKVTVVQCSGRIVAGSAAESLRALLVGKTMGQTHFVLHLGEVHFIDSSGLGMMVRLLTITRRSQGDLKLCSVPAAIQKLLEMTNLDKLFEIHEAEESAIAAFYQRSTRADDAAVVSGPLVLCIDQSSEVLAYLRELLKRSGYEVHTSSSLPDAMILLRAMRPAVLLRGPNLGGAPATRQALEAACGHMVVLELGNEFSILHAGEAGTTLLASIQAKLQSVSAS
jgi:anti-sigma B factor antagonist